MPDDGTEDQQTPQQNTTAMAGQVLAGAASPSASPMSGGTGFFKGLLGTLLSGIQAGAQAPRGPNGPAVAAQIASQNPAVNKQVRDQQAQQKQEQMDARTQRQLQLAQNQINMLHTYHMMLNEDQEHQEQAFNDTRDYVRKMDEQGQYKWFAQSENRDDVVKEQQKMRAQLMRQGDVAGANSMQVLMRPEASYTSQKWGVARSLGDPLKADLTTVIHGHPDKGIPDQTFTANKGQTNPDVLYYKNLKDQTSSVSAARNAAPVNPIAALTVDDVRSQLLGAGFKPPTNLSDIWAVYTGEGSAKDLLSNKPGKGEFNKEQAFNFIKNIDPNFNPEIADRVGDYAKMLEQSETNYAKSGGDARQAVANAQRVRDDDKAPYALKHRAEMLQKAAQPLVDMDHEDKIAKGEERADKILNTEIDKAQAPVQKAMTTDEGKVQDLQNAIDTLNKGGGEGDSIAAISALRGLVGGGGVRITGAELNSVAKQRGWTGSLDVMLNNLVDPKQYASLSTTQRTQLKQILSDAYAHIKKRDDAHQEAYDKITNATSVRQLRSAQTELANKLKIPALGTPMKFPDGHTYLVSADKMDAAKAAKAVPVQ